MSRFKDSLVLMGWIAGLILIAGLFWFLTRPVRDRFLLNAVNQALQQSGDSRRLGEPAVPGEAGELSGSLILGSWFTMSGRDLAEGRKVFVFAFVAGGSFFPCAAMVDSGGKVEEFVPLDEYGKKIIGRLSPGILRIYARRIEGKKS